jgi:hypothetical protein
MGPDIVRSHLSMDVRLTVNVPDTDLSRSHKTTAVAMTRVAIAMTWTATTSIAIVRVEVEMMARRKPCTSLSGRLLLGSCGSSAPFVLRRSMIPRPRWCITA